MSTRHLPRAIASRGKTAVEIERENFEKSQVDNVVLLTGSEKKYCKHISQTHVFNVYLVVHKV